MSLSILPSECDCDRCSKMCHAPCCGTVEEIKKLIEMGYSDRLMLDDIPPDDDILKPALKGYEGHNAPWNTFSEKGCTFWKNGLCELHDSGLKPLGGKIAHHSLSNDQYEELGDYLNKIWMSEDAKQLIDEWIKSNDH